ncbi:MAG TPA: hypothetical protein VGI29_14155 [Candidatus Binataceae bacterium]
MHSEILVIDQGAAHGIRHSAHAYLQGRAVGHEVNDVFADRAIQIVHRARRQLGQRAFVLDNRGGQRDVQRRIAKDPRHPRIYFEDEPLRGARGRDRVIAVRAATEKSALVHRRDASLLPDRD